MLFSNKTLQPDSALFSSPWNVIRTVQKFIRCFFYEISNVNFACSSAEPFVVCNVYLRFEETVKIGSMWDLLAFGFAIKTRSSWDN